MDRLVSKFKRRSSKGQDQAEVTQFRHTSLDPRQPKAIRLIRINSKLRDGLIDCEIREATLDADYCTLSYVCGDANNLRPILLNRQTYYVTRNLWSFLDCARAQFSEKVFWIDSMSIHQGDVQEKGQQVSMMSEIYSQTRQVHIWLGPDHSEGSYVLDRINTCRWVIGSPLIPACLENEDFFTGLKVIHNSEYWNRAWTMQEFVLPRAGLLLMGRASTTLEHLDIFSEYCYEAFKRNTHRRETLRRLFTSVITWNGRELWQMRKKRLESGVTQLEDFLEPRACFDIRDRLYAALPFHEWSGRFRVSYLLNPFELLLEYMANDQLQQIQPIYATANLLHLTPITIMLYTQPERTFRSPGDRYVVALPRDAETLHLHSAASSTVWSTDYEWASETPAAEPYTAASNSSLQVWQDAQGQMPGIDIAETLKRNHIRFDLVAGTQGVVTLKHIPTEPADIFLVLAGTNSRTHGGTELPDVRSLTQGSRCCLVSGKYISKCRTPPDTVYFALLENPEMHTKVSSRGRIPGRSSAPTASSRLNNSRFTSQRDNYSSDDLDWAPNSSYEESFSTDSD